MRYNGEFIRNLQMALNTQGFGIDDLTTEQFLETLILVEEKKEKTTIEDTAKISSKFRQCRVKKEEIENSKSNSPETSS